MGHSLWCIYYETASKFVLPCRTVAYSDMDVGQVKPVEPERVLNKGAYMLFYSRYVHLAGEHYLSGLIWKLG